MKTEPLDSPAATALAVQQGVESLAPILRAESATALRTRGRRHARRTGHVIVGGPGWLALLFFFVGYPKGDNGWFGARVRFGAGERDAAATKLTELGMTWFRVNLVMGSRLLGPLDLPGPGLN